MRFQCGYCEDTIHVDTGDWNQLRDDDGTYPRHRVHTWLGERVMTALSHHITKCAAAPPVPDSRPNLTLVVSR